MAKHTPIADCTKPNRVPVTGATIVATWNEPDRDGNYPAFIALAKDEKATGARCYSTHLVVFNDDCDQWSAMTGNYDLTRDAAKADFARRAGL